MKNYERIEQKDITHIEIWEDCIRIHLIDKCVMDFEIKKDEELEK